MLKLSKILEKLARSQEAFLRTADAIPAIQWNIFPKPGTWSAAEVVAHLITVETTVLSTARKLQAKLPRKFPPWKRLHLPLLLVEMRVARRRTAMPSDPRLIRAKDLMLEELREVRKRTVAFLEETKGRDLSVYLWPHPFLGNLDSYHWFCMIAAHEVRHAKQIREICNNLPKCVSCLQK